MTFPTTPILDNFNRANEGPPPSANWTTISWDDEGLKVSSNACIPDADVSANEYGSYWNVGTFGPDCEAYFTISHTGTFSVGSPKEAQCYLLIDDPVAFNNYYLIAVGSENASDYTYVRLYRNGSTKASNNVLTGSDGDKWGVQVLGGTVTVYRYPFGGSSWQVELTYVDPSPIVSAGYLALGSRPETGAHYIIDDFGGGTISAPTPPVADFSGTPLAGGKPLSVAFTDTSTESPTSWLWDFGDGDISAIQNPIHVYSADGVYTVALTATNGDGSDTETKVDYVTVAVPVANFSGTPTSGTVPLSVDFTDLSTNVPTSWFWDFGDGGSSATQDPTYVYNYIGTYTVTLTASNGSGSDSEVKVAYITVTAVVEYGAAVIENCDIDTGGAAVGLRVADVAIARDNRLESVMVDALAELRAKDNSYTTLINNGTLQPLAGDRSVFDAIGYAARHTNDADDSATAIHHTLGTGADQAAAGNHAHAGMGTVTNIATGTGLTGGPITTTGTISDANTGVAAATYGDASNIPQIAVNAQGRITAASNIAISVFTPINVYNETITADGLSTIYYLLNIAAPSTIRVYIDGIRQPATDDIAPTDIVTFDAAPDLGAVLLFDYEMDIT